MPSSDPLNNNGGTDADIAEIEDQVGDAYNNVNLSGAGTDLEFFTPNGGTTAVKSITLPSGGGGGSSFEAFNSVSELNGVFTFGTNYGNSIGTTIDIGGITTNSASISGLSTTVGTHTTAIDDVEAAIETQVSIEVPFDFPEFDMTSNNTTVNGVTYIASGSNSNPWEGFSTSGEYESSSYETLIGTRFDYGGSEGDSGSYDYAGTDNLGTGAVDGSWLKLQLPEPRAVSGFKIRNFDNEEDCVLGWNIYASSNDSDWTLLGSYLTNHKNKPTHSVGGNTYDLDSTLAGYGQLYSYYAIVFTRVFGGESSTRAYAKLRELRFIGGTRLAAHVGAVSRTNTLNISTLEQRDKFKDIHEHPDLHDECYLAQLHDNNKSLTVNGRTYTFTSSSHTEYPRHYEYYAFMEVTGELWESDGNTYNTLDGNYRNYSGSASLGGISGEWLQVKLPEPIILNSFKLRTCDVEDGGMPRSFTIIASNDGTNYDTLQSYSDVSVSNTAETLFQIDSTASNYGNKYSYYAIVITRIDPNPKWGTVHYKSVQIRRWRLFSVNDDVADCIKKTDESFNSATITGTNTLNLISDSGTTSLTLPGGTTAATSVEALTFNFTVQTVSGSDYYFLNGMKGSTAPLELLFMHKYIFTFPSSHPLKLSRTPDGTHAGGTEWTTGVTVDSSTQITFVNQSPHLLENLYYYCGNHSGMGGTIIEENGYNNITEIDYNTTTAIPQLEVTRAHGNVITHLDHIPLSDSFVSAQKDGDNIKLTSITGVETSIGPFSGGGTAASSTTNYPTSALTSNGGFSGTPPSAIALGGYWATGGSFAKPRYYAKNTSDETTTFVRYVLTDPNGQVGANYGIAFYVDTNNDLILDAEWSVGGTATPFNLKVNGGAAVTSSVVQAGDAIELLGTGTSVEATLTVPSELAVYTITTSASTEYNLFTDKLFGTDNLGNIGTVGTSNWDIQQWVYDVSDGNVIVTAYDAHTRFIKITLDGNLVFDSAGNNGRYILNSNLVYTSAADLIADYNSAQTGYSPNSFAFNKHSLFDLAVNNSPAFKAFDEVSTSEWVSHSNTYDVTTGDALQPGFSGTPPVNINLPAGSWASNGWNYVRTTYTDNYALYDLSVGTGYGIVFSMSNKQLTLDVNDATHGNPGIPASFTINGTTASNPGIVAPNDTIRLLNGSGGLEAQFTVPSELAVVGSKLASTTDAGEFLKISLDSSVEATTLSLKSIAEYKEPRINMTGYSQCGYEVTASSEHTGREVYLAFNSLTHVAVVGGDGWYTAANTFAGGNHNTSANLGTDTTGGSTINGEYAILNLPDKRKLNSYLIARQDGYTNGFPKDWKVYGRQTMTSNWELIDERTGEAPAGYNSGSVDTGGSVYSAATTTKYQSFALVVSKIDMTGTTTRNNVRVAEIKFNCQPSEIAEFKLYGSTDDVAWTEIHHQSTSANITTSGNNFTIANPGSYQHYGLVIIKNYGYHNVSLSELKLGRTETVDLTNYYTRPQVDSLIPKGVFAEGSYHYTGNNSATYQSTQGSFTEGSNLSGPTTQTHALGNWGHPPWWASAPHCHEIVQRFYFTTPYIDNIGEPSSHYKVVLTKRKETMYDIFVEDKQPTYFDVKIFNSLDPGNNYITGYKYDIVVF